MLICIIKSQEIQHSIGSGKLIMLFFLLTNVKMPTIVGILTFMSRKNFMLNLAEHKKKFYNLGARFHLLAKFGFSKDTIIEYSI